MNETIYSQIRDILSDLLITGNPDMDTPLLGKNGIMDSLTAAQFIACVEDTFEVDITGQDLDLKCMESVRTLAIFLEKAISV